MAIRKILKIGDETLRKHARPVAEVDRRTKQLLDDMAETMYAADGAGLAAPQVGILRRVVVIDVGEGLIELVNPEIVASEGEQHQAEGWYTGGNGRSGVGSAAKVTVRALNRRGKPVEIVGEGFLATALCHEIDHLDGVLYVDKLIEELPEEDAK